jgi:uncharacterized repeat protein (TIGR03803 family)
MILALLALTSRASAQWVQQSIKSFGLPAQRAVYPYAGLIQGTDGAFYGTTVFGGISNLGTVFRLSTAGDSCTVLHSFDGGGGSTPYAELVQGLDGALYGTTFYGGASNVGTVFKLDTDGTGFTVLHSFRFAPGGQEGFGPHAGLLQGTDGALYGTTYDGGTNRYGTIFRLSPDGTAYAVLYNFTGQGGDGGGPYAGLVQGTDGALYGTTYSGGTSNFGTVFKLGTDGSGYKVLYRFTGSGGDGRSPSARLLQGSDGALYGTTRYGGSNSFGTVFRLGTDGSDYAVLCPLTQYAYPTAGLSQGPDGTLNGLGTGIVSPYYNTYFGFLFRINTNGSGYVVLHSFGATSFGSAGRLAVDGENPYGGLVLAADGAFYGTTHNGGVNGFGTVFRLAASGTETNFYNFTGNGGDGITPAPGLMQAADGALYGTTTSGGSNNLGTIFRLNIDGTDYTLLYSFTGTNGDCSQPNGLMQGVDGVLYGTTSSGGANSAGTLFSLNTNGSGYTVLFSFSSSTGSPSSRLVQGPDGTLYGSTPGGSLGGGTVFKIATNGNGYAMLYSFTGTGGDGASPYGPLVLGSDGGLYGTTYQGSTVFKLNTDGTGYTILYSPVGGTGSGPYAGLIQGSDGAVYGNTFGGGIDCFTCAAADWGTVFKLNTDGSSYAVLRNFTGSGTDAAGPHAELVQGHDGQLYGTTFEGGANNNGTVFKLSTNGTDYAVLYSFPPRGVLIGSDGPSGGVLPGSDGALYGTSLGGGAFGYGTVYRLVWAPPPWFSDISRLPDRSIHLTLWGTSNLLWRVQVATNLQAPIAWMPLLTLTTTNGSAQFTDLGATNSTCRFYQATWP